VDEGGIWTTLATGDIAANGNLRGASSKQNPVLGTHGVILLVGIGTLKNIRFEDLTFNRAGIIEVHSNIDGLVIQNDFPIGQLVKVIEQKLNPDYPKTTPHGGTGKGIWIQ